MARTDARRIASLRSGRLRALNACTPMARTGCRASSPLSKKFTFLQKAGRTLGRVDDPKGTVDARPYDLTCLCRHSSASHCSVCAASRVNKRTRDDELRRSGDSETDRRAPTSARRARRVAPGSTGWSHAQERARIALRVAARYPQAAERNWREVPRRR